MQRVLALTQFFRHEIRLHCRLLFRRQVNFYGQTLLQYLVHGQGMNREQRLLSGKLTLCTYMQETSGPAGPLVLYTSTIIDSLSLDEIDGLKEFTKLIYLARFVNVES